MAKIGIFWVYENRVIGKAVDLEEGREYVPGIIDSPYDHINIWEKSTGLLTPFPDLRGTEYHMLPRGRVLYAKNEESSVIYMDKCLFEKEMKHLISVFFELETVEKSWRTDSHYTTDTETIMRLLDGN